MSDSKPPSRRRYEAENPTVSFRISKDAKEELEALTEDLEITKKCWFEQLIQEEEDRYSDVFQEGHSKGKQEGYDDGYEDGYEEGRKDGYQEFVATVPCIDCGKPVAVNSEQRKKRVYEAIERLNQDWSSLPPPGTLTCEIRHSDCPTDA